MFSSIIVMGMFFLIFSPAMVEFAVFLCSPAKVFVVLGCLLWTARPWLMLFSLVVVLRGGLMLSWILPCGECPLVTLSGWCVFCFDCWGVFILHVMLVDPSMFCNCEHDHPRVDCRFRIFFCMWSVCWNFDIVWPCCWLGMVWQSCWSKCVEFT